MPPPYPRKIVPWTGGHPIVGYGDQDRGQQRPFGLTARKRGKDLFVTDVWRERLEFPDLKRKTVEFARLHGARTLLIEDKASGQQLIQALRAEDLAGVPNPIARNPEMDKYSRAAGVSSIVEAGQIFVPAEAHWLADFSSELLDFPNCWHDDQVDPLAQLLG